jgi:drug/metabolite transporter (DMT)-like permease
MLERASSRAGSTGGAGGAEVAAPLPGSPRGGFLVGLAWMIAACAGFACMLLLIRITARSGIHPFEIAFFRNFFALIVLMPWLLRVGWHGLATRRHGLYALRSTTGVASMLSWFWAVSVMPMAEAVALSFTAPFFVTILAALVLGEVVRIRRWSAVCVGFVGALIIVRPDAPAIAALPLAMILFSTVMNAGSTICVKSLTHTENPTAIVAYMAIIYTPLTLIPALFVWRWPSAAELGLLSALGVIATLAHICWTRALSATEVSAIVPFDFARLVFAALLGWLFFREVTTLATWLGSAIIVASGIYIARREAIAARERRGSPPAATPGAAA